MNELKEIEQASARVERAMDEAYSRYLHCAEDERIGGVATGIRTIMESVPPGVRTFLLEMLEERYEPEGGRIVDPSTAIEIAALRAENERLRAELDESPRREGADGNVLQALLGDGDGGAEPADAEAVAEVIQLLVSFADGLARVYSDSSGRGAGRRSGNAFKESLRRAVAGEQGLAGDLDRIKAAIGGQLLAFKRACSRGSQFLLQELDPLVLEERASSSGFGPFGLFRSRELWRAFQRRFAELIEDEDLYDSYFEPYYKSESQRKIRTKSNG